MPQTCKPSRKLGNWQQLSQPHAPAPDAPNPPASLSQATANTCRSHMPQPSFSSKGVQACRLPAPECLKPRRRPAGLSQATANTCRSHMPQPRTLAGLSQATANTCRSHTPAPNAATCPSHIFLKAFKPAVCPPPNASNPSAGPHVFPRQLPTPLAATCPSHLFLRAFKPAVCPLPNANPSACLPRQWATPLAATCPSHLFLTAFKPATCLSPERSKPFRKPFPGNCQHLSQPHAPAPNAPNPPAGLSQATANTSRSHMPQPQPSFSSKGVQACRLPAPECLKPFRRPSQASGNISRSHMTQPSVFKGVQACRLAPPNASNPSAGLSQETANTCRSPLQTLPQAFPRQAANTSLRLLLIVYNSDLAMIVHYCFWLWFRYHCWSLFMILVWLWFLMFFHDFDLDTTVDDCLCFCFPVALFFHDPAWDMIVDYCFYFSCGYISWSCPATPQRGVGGTRALAHSICIYVRPIIYAMYNKQRHRFNGRWHELRCKIIMARFWEIETLRMRYSGSISRFRPPPVSSLGARQ